MILTLVILYKTYTIIKCYFLRGRTTMFFMAMGISIMMNMSIEPWRSVNDGVMGGVSSGGMISTPAGLAFQGQLSLENNGGFSSVRRLVDEDLTHSYGIRLSVKGDGRSYQLRLRQDRNYDGVAWRREFTTDGSVQTFEFEYSSFEPVFRGRIVNSAGKLDPAQITQLGFLIADKLEGHFSLSIRKMEVMR